MSTNLLVLGIESSCDETGVALLQARGQELPVLLAHALYSQVEMHGAYGGVVPERASSDHIRHAGRPCPCRRDNAQRLPGGCQQRQLAADSFRGGDGAYCLFH